MEFRLNFDHVWACALVACMKGRDKYLCPTDVVGNIQFSLFFIPAFRPQVLHLLTMDESSHRSVESLHV